MIQFASTFRNLNSSGIDQGVKKIGVLNYKLKLQFKRLTLKENC